MLYLIDAHNLIYHIKDLRLLISSGDVAGARAGLIRFFSFFPDDRKAALFFDGHPRNENFSESNPPGNFIPIKNNLEINFSRKMKADEKILQFAKENFQKTGKKINAVAVSSDKKLKFLLRPYIKKIIDSNCFAEFLYTSYNQN